MKDLVQVVTAIEGEFQKVNTVNLPFHKETEFALQALGSNDFLAKVAVENKESLRNAIVNIATVGLSLNPVLKYGYLLPRKVSGKYKVCLDFSYMGLAKIVIDSGSATAIKSDVVYTNDLFEYNGPFALPKHIPSYLSEEKNYSPDRGSKYAVWVSIKLADGTYVTGTMSIADVHKIRDRSSESWKAYVKDNSKPTPWVSDEDEMIKKTIIRREYKLWPKTERLAAAISLINEHDGIDFKKELTDVTAPTDEMLNELREKLKEANKTEKALLDSLPKHDCISLDELNLDQVSHGLNLVNKLLANKKGAQNVSNN